MKKLIISLVIVCLIGAIIPVKTLAEDNVKKASPEIKLLLVPTIFAMSVFALYNTNISYRSDEAIFWGGAAIITLGFAIAF